MKALILIAVCFVLAIIPNAESREKAKFWERVASGKTHQEGDDDWFI
jgi:hypothetical protein